MEAYACYRVLAHLMTSKYLHREIREKGGAYGGGSIARPGVLFFYSYRDPHASGTLANFQNALNWACHTEFQEQDINEAKLAVLQELDQPVSAGSKGLTNFLNGISDDLRQSHRTQLFSVKSTELHQIANQISQQLLSNDSNQMGQVILGPESSPDWNTNDDDDSDKNGSKWERVHLID